MTCQSGIEIATKLFFMPEHNKICMYWKSRFLKDMWINIFCKTNGSADILIFEKFKTCKNQCKIELLGY